MADRKYPHPGFENVSQIEYKLWEIRNQLEINIDIMHQSCPVSEMTMGIFGHPIDVITGHVFDRLNELEAMLK